MKNLFIILCICVIAPSMAQVSMEKVLVEMGTATWSMDCASEVAIIQQMQEEGLEIKVINYHLNDAFANQYANQRASYYNMQTVPFPVIGGQEVIPGDYDSYLAAYNQSHNNPSSFTLSATGHFEDDTLVLSVSINKVAAYESDSISLLLTFTESNIAFPWQGLEEVHDVERIIAPDAAGIDLDFSSSNSIELEERILFDRNWDPAQMDMIAFIQNDTSKAILQTHSLSITDFAPLPAHAFFQVVDTIICQETGVHFENNSTGDIEYIHWFFEGGNPAESSEFEPFVDYHEEGVYDVKLVVSNSVSTDTTYIDDFIHVKPLPEMSIDIFPEFCHYHFAYEMIEGQPDGGHYFGDFVDSGYFHPEAAGIGIHSIYFTYQNPQSLCSDTLSQDAEVFLCESIGEVSLSNNLYVSNKGNTIHVSLSNLNNDHINEIQAFDLQGRLLYSLRDLPKSTQKTMFILKEYNPFIILHVHSTKQVLTLKYKMD